MALHEFVMLLTVILPGQTIAGAGFTTTVAVAVLLHPSTNEVMVKVTVTGALVVLVSVPLIFPLPLPPIPVTDATLSRVHVNDAPDMVLEGMIPVMALPLQTDCVVGETVVTPGSMIEIVLLDENAQPYGSV